MKSKITVVIPIYNSEASLQRCIESVLNQKYNNFELLLIDDGSTDTSGKICDSYVAKDSRVKVFHKKNGGVSSARNLGLENSRGEWITFVDADDWIKTEYLEHLVSHIQENVDLVISYSEIFRKNYSYIEKYPSQLINDSNFEIMFSENDMYWHTAPWSKLYRSSLIQDLDLKFKEGMHIGEDACFLYEFMLGSRNIFISSDTDYCYNQVSENSLTKRMNSLDSELFSYHNIKNIVNKIFESKDIKDPIAKKHLQWVIASYVRRVTNAIYFYNIHKNERIRILKELDFSAYLNSIEYDNIMQRMLDFFLKIRLYGIYDFIRHSKSIVKKALP